jgi:hypothetical protein
MVFVYLTITFALSCYVVTGAENRTWILGNLGIITGSLVVGLVLSLFLGSIQEGQLSMFEPVQVASVVVFLGASIAVVGNKWREGGIRKGRRPPSDKTVV